ncbi:MAG: Transcriptional regulator, LysR family protein [Pseudomonas sp.]|jgi:DNA-binding transcriptional LysR family regulator|uniref:LysR family transcriptional regulator n=1 Tax=Pseudomonas sp. TaxID=306 RepID=UPI00261F4AB4|nr:LysR family transcriptional regulator [Pseudomonas sp.]MDB6048709.1 Transcriptional regulator, LysR family protein [Pseudomonas sp.]
MFQLTQLRCFVAVATELHFGRAAQRLNMTQSPLSRQIQALEHDLGVLLIARTRRSVQLTPAGIAFLPEAEDILLRCESAALAARRAIRGDAGSVALGFISAARFKVLPEIVSGAYHSLKDIDVVLKEMSTPEQKEALLSSRLNLGLIRPVKSHPGIETVCVLRDPFTLALPYDHPLTKRDHLTVHDLDRQPFIMYSPSDGRYSFELLSGLFRAAGVEPSYVQYLYQTHTILSLVSIGLGIALVPSTAQHLPSERIVFKQIELGGASAELHLAWRKNDPDPVTQSFRAFILGLG